MLAPAAAPSSSTQGGAAQPCVAPELNPSRALIKGVVCGVRVEDIKESTMQGIRYLDKLIDERAKGKTMEKILRK